MYISSIHHLTSQHQSLCRSIHPTIRCSNYKKTDHTSFQQDPKVPLNTLYYINSFASYIKSKSPRTSTTQQNIFKENYRPHTQKLIRINFRNRRSLYTKLPPLKCYVKKRKYKENIENLDKFYYARRNAYTRLVCKHVLYFSFLSFSVIMCLQVITHTIHIKYVAYCLYQCLKAKQELFSK